MTTANAQQSVDRKAMYELAFRILGDMGASFSMSLGYIGMKLGLFDAMSGAGDLTAKELAEKCNLDERYVLEWLKGMVAAEYLEYNPGAKKYFMTAEQALVLTDKDSPVYMGGAIQFTTPSILNSSKLLDVFRKGKGIPYAEIGDEIPEAIERLFGPAYSHKLAQEWLPSIPELKKKLEDGARVLDLGCGCGRSTVAMAKAYPNSQFVGLDIDGRSIRRANCLKAERSLGNVDFVEKPIENMAKEETFDLICAFDCIHDMVKPRETLKTVRQLLKDDGVLLWIEPNASDNPLENRNIVGRAYAAISPHHCLTVSLAHGGDGLGTTIGERGAKELAGEAGFSGFRKLPIEDAMSMFFLAHK